MGENVDMEKFLQTTGSHWLCTIEEIWNDFQTNPSLPAYVVEMNDFRNNKEVSQQENNFEIVICQNKIKENPWLSWS